MGTLWVKERLHLNLRKWNLTHRSQSVHSIAQLVSQSFRGWGKRILRLTWTTRWISAELETLYQKNPKFSIRIISLFHLPSLFPYIPLPHSLVIWFWSELGYPSLVWSWTWCLPVRIKCLSHHFQFVYLFFFAVLSFFFICFDSFTKCITFRNVICICPDKLKL